MGRTMRWLFAVPVLCAACFSKPGYTGEPGDGGPGDGGPGDGTITANRMFVSSTQVVASQLGGAAAADAICQDLASSKGFPGTYLAYLSTSTQSARERILAGRPEPRGWVRPDGKPVADRLAELVLGNLFYPPRLTETGGDIGANELKILTATFSDGVADASATCTDYSADGIVLNGRADSAGRPWVELAQNGCSDTYHLYCVGVDAAVPVAVEPPAASRLAFISSRVPAPTGLGLGVLDTLCAVDASGIGASGTFRAAVPEGTGTVAERFDTTSSLVWARSDGVVVLSADMTKIHAPALDTAGLLADRSILSGGAVSLTSRAPGTMCADWTSTAATDTFQVGRAPPSTPGRLPPEGSGTCDQPAVDQDTDFRVLCLQE